MYSKKLLIWYFSCHAAFSNNCILIPVYPPDSDGEDLNEESDLTEEEMDETCDDKQPATSESTSSGNSAIVVGSSSSETAPGDMGI